MVTTDKPPLVMTVTLHNIVNLLLPLNTNTKARLCRTVEIGRIGKIGHSDEIVEKFKFKFKFLTDNTMKLIWGYLTTTMNIGRSGEIVEKFNPNTNTNVFDEIVVKFKFNAMKLVENKSVVLSWVFLQPFWG